MLELVLIALAIFAGFFVQSVIGFAAPLIALPILTRFIGLKSSVGLISVFLLLFSILMTRTSWKNIDRKVVLQLATGGVLGMLIGVYALQYGNPIYLTKLLGLFIIFFVVYQFFSKRKIKTFQRFGWFFGFIAGVFSGMFSSGGPFYAAYIYNKLDDPTVIRSTIIVALGVSNVLRFFILIPTKIITAQTFAMALIMLPGFLLALYLGQRLHKRLSSEQFKQAVMAFLVLSGISLLVV